MCRMGDLSRMYEQNASFVVPSLPQCTFVCNLCKKEKRQREANTKLILFTSFILGVAHVIFKYIRNISIISLKLCPDAWGKEGGMRKE